MRGWVLAVVYFLSVAAGQAEGTNFNGLGPEALSHINALKTGSAAAGATNASPVSASRLDSMELLDDKQKLGAADRVSIRIVEDREDPKELFVTDSGELEVPYIGRVSALGKTCKQLAGEIKTLLDTDYYYDATVILAVDLLNKSRGKIYLVGQVRAAGPQDIPSDEDFTLSKAILRAGGFSDFADKKRVKITRKGESQPLLVDVGEILERGKVGTDLRLKPDDLIFIPARLLNL